MSFVVVNEYIENILRYIEIKELTELYDNVYSMYKKSQNRLKDLVVNNTLTIDNTKYTAQVEYIAKDINIFHIYKDNSINSHLDNDILDIINISNNLPLYKTYKPIGFMKVINIKNKDKYIATSFNSNKYNGYHITSVLLSSMLLTNNEKDTLKSVCYKFNVDDNDFVINYINYNLSTLDLSLIKTTSNDIEDIMYKDYNIKVDNAVKAMYGKDLITNKKMYNIYKNAANTILNIFNTNLYSFLMLDVDDMYNIIKDKAQKGFLSKDELDIILYKDSDNIVKGPTPNIYLRRLINKDDFYIVDLSFILHFQQVAKAYMLKNKDTKNNNLLFENEYIVYRNKKAEKVLLSDYNKAFVSYDSKLYHTYIKGLEGENRPYLIRKTKRSLYRNKKTISNNEIYRLLATINYNIEDTEKTDRAIIKAISKKTDYDIIKSIIKSTNTFTEYRYHRLMYIFYDILKANHIKDKDNIYLLTKDYTAL